MAQYFWNKEKSKFISLEKIRNFEIQVKGNKVKIIGWFSDTETIEVGEFSDKEQAHKFLETLEPFAIQVK